MSLEKRFNKRLIGLIMGEKYTKEEPESKPGFIETGINELKKSLFPKKKKKPQNDSKDKEIPQKKEEEKKEEKKSDSSDTEDW